MVEIVAVLAEGTHPWRLLYNGMEHLGEVVVAQAWNDHWGREPSGGLSFRVVLLTTLQEGPSPTAVGKRIAVCMPQRVRPREREEAARALRSVREARERYLAGADPALASLGRSLQDEEQTLLARLSRQVGQEYAAGRIIASSPLVISPGSCFSTANLTTGIEAVAKEVLRHAFPHPAIDPSTLPNPLRQEELKLLFDALFYPTANEQAISMLQSFASPLGLLPPRFEGCAAVELIARELEAQGGAISAQPLLQRLGEGLGLPSAVATLYLLAFLFRNTPAVELTLQPDHPLRCRDGSAFPGDRLSWDLLTEIEWGPDMLSALDTLRIPGLPLWRTVLPYALALLPTLERHPSPQQEPEQQALMGRILQRVQVGLSELEEALSILEGGLAQVVPPPVRRQLQLLDTVFGSSEPFTFYQNCRRADITPPVLREAIAAYGRLTPLVDAVPEIVSTQAYLEQADPGAGVVGLAGDRTLLMARLDLPSFTANPGIWPSVRSAFLQFKERYTQGYWNHHARYHQESLNLQTRLARALPQVQALELFNSFGDLGEPVNPGLPGRRQAVSILLKSCLNQQTATDLQQEPFCTSCQLRLSEDVPRQEVEEFLLQLEQALREQNRRMSSHAIQQVLAQPGTEPVDRFIKLVQVSDLDALANVLDAEVLDFLRAFLGGSQTAL